jgi:hypothetical protein
VTFYSHTLYLLCISFVISVSVINMSRNRKRSAVPKSIKLLLLDSFIGSALGGKQAEPIAVDGHGQGEELKEADSDDHQIIQVTSAAKAHIAQNEWIRLAIVIDRLAFVIYIIVFALMGFLHFV